MRIRCRLLIRLFVVSAAWETNLVKVRYRFSSKISANIQIIEQLFKTDLLPTVMDRFFSRL